MPDLKQSLRDFVATSNSGKYKTEGEIMSKFPELKGYDINVLRDFVATSNSGKYKSEEEVFSKFPEFNFGTPKKKVPTQVSKPSVGSSGTTETPQKQSSDSSKPDGIYKFPTNLKANYKKENGQWYVDPSGGTKFQPLTKGDVTKRVKVLESQARLDEDLTFSKTNKKETVLTLPGSDSQSQAINEKAVGDASDRAKAKVFTGYPGKEENKYRVIDGIWQYSKPNAKGEYSEWGTITNENSIKALNTQFKQNAGLDVVKTVDEYKNLDFKDINSNLIGGDEEDAVPLLNNKYRSLGFSFRTGLGDQMIVKSSIDGVPELTIDMDSWDAAKDANNAARLRAYLAENSLTPEKKKELAFEKQATKILSKGIYNAPDKIQKNSDGTLQSPIMNVPKIDQGFVTEFQQAEKQVKLRELEKQTGLDMDKIQAEKARKATMYGSSRVIKNDLTAKAISAQNQVNKVYVDNEIKDINLRDKYTQRLITDYETDKADYEANYSSYTEAQRVEKENELRLKAEELKKSYDETKKDSEKINYLIQSQAASTISSKLVKEKTGTVAGSIGRSLTDAIIDSSLGISQAVGNNVTTQERQRAKDDLAALFTHTTSEFSASEDRSLLTKTVQSLVQMTPAIASGIATGGSTAGAAYFWGMSYSNSYDSMDGLDIPEEDKKTMSAVIATATAALESYGLEKITSNKAASGFVAKRVARLLSGLPKGATMEMMNTAIYADMKKVVADKLIKVAGKGIIEGGVEVSQSAAETGIKELYDLTRDKEVFTEDWGTFGKNALDEFLIGAFAGSTVNAMSNLGTTVQQLRDPENFGLAKEIATDEDLQDLFKNDLKSKIIQGEMTIPEAKAKLRAVGEFKALLGKVPSNMLETNQQEAMNLIEEKQKLQSEIEGKEPSLVEDQKQRIVDIDNEMKQLVEDDAKGEIRITARGLDQVPTEFRDRARYRGTSKVGRFGKTTDDYVYTVTRDEYTKLKGNAVQERSTEEVLPREQEQAGETGGQREGMGQSLEGQEVTQESTQKVEDLRAQEQAELMEAIPNAEQYMTDGKVDRTKITDENDLKVFDEIYNKYDKIITPLIKEVDAVEEPLKEKKVAFHGGNLSKGVDGVLYVSEDKSQAEEYAKGNDGEINEIDVTDLNIANENDVVEIIKENGFKPKNEDYSVDELNLYELIDPRFEESLSEDDLKKLSKILIDKGIDAVRFTDTNLKTLKQDIENIAIFNVDKVKLNTPTLDDVKTLDTTDATNLQRVLGFIESIENDLDNFGKGTLGMNLPVAVAKAVIKSIKVLLQAGVTLEQAIKQAAVDNNVTEQDIMDTMVAVQASQATKNRVRAKVTGQKAPKVSPAAKAAKAITKKPAPKMVTVDEMAALKDQIRLEARAARGAKANIKENIEKISTLIKSMVTAKGNIKQRHLKYIFNKLASTNLTSDESVDKLLDYIFKKMTDANYLNKLDEIEKINKSIKNNKSIVEPIASTVKEFANINPTLVDNIDAHLAIAKQIKESLSRYKKEADPLGIEFRKNFDFNKVFDYVQKNNDKILKKSKKEISDIYDTMFGENSSDGMTDEDMSKKIKEAKENELNKLKSFVQQKISSIKAIVENDPDVSDLVKRAANVDVDYLNLSDAIDVVNALTMYLDNGFETGLNKIVANYEGTKAIADSNLKFAPIGLLRAGRSIARGYNSLFNYIESMLEKKSLKSGDVLKFLKESGLGLIQNGYNRSENETNQLRKDYKNKFRKVKNFFDSENKAERALLSFVQRNVLDSEGKPAEFLRRKKLVLESINQLRNAAGRVNLAIADLQEEAAKKLGILKSDGTVNESITIDEINNNAENSNLEAVKWMQDMWYKKYPSLYDHALGMHNTLIGRDEFYTPDRYSSIERAIPDDPNLIEFINFTGMTVNKSGVLMEARRPEALTDRFINMDFEDNNFGSYRAAMNDLYTAEARTKYKAYQASSKFDDIMGRDKYRKSKDADIIREAYKRYITAKENKGAKDSEVEKNVKKFLSKLSTLSGAAALGSFKNVLAQTFTTYFDTIFAVGPRSVATIFKDSFDPEVQKFIAKADSQVANRGMDAIKFTEKIQDEVMKRSKAAEAAGTVFDAPAWLAEKMLEYTNQKGDKLAAIGAWMAYYRKYCRKNGIKVDLNNVNEDAAQYAETRTKVQILPSDAAERGILGSNNTVWASGVRQILFPFSSFSINQKNRIYGDIAKITRGEWSLKKESIQDLTGAIAGLMTFHTINIAWKYFVIQGAISLFLDDEDEEALKKAFESALKLTATQGLTDLFSAIPLLDPLVVGGANWMLGEGEDNMFAPSEDKWLAKLAEINQAREDQGKRELDEDQEKKRREKFFKDEEWKFYEDEDITYLDKFGVYGIAAQKAVEFKDIAKSAATGIYEDNYQGNMTEKTLTKEGKDKMEALALVKAVGIVTGATDLSNIAQKAFYKVGKKYSLTDNQVKISEETKEWAKEHNHKLDKYDEQLIKIHTTLNQIKRSIRRMDNMSTKEKEEYIKTLKTD